MWRGFRSYYLPPAAVPGWLVGCTKMCRWMISFQLEQMVNKLLFKSTWSGYVWSGRRATNIIIISTVAVAAAKWMDVCHLIVASSKAIQSLKTTTNHQSGWRTSQMSDVKWLAAGRPIRKGVLFRDNLSCSPVPVPPLLLVSSSVFESKILKNTQPEGLTMDLTMSRLNVVFLSN